MVVEIERGSVRVKGLGLGWFFCLVVVVYFIKFVLDFWSFFGLFLFMFVCEGEDGEVKFCVGFFSVGEGFCED